MCELLALSANTPTDMTFSFRGLARRGGATGEHGDGWGLATFDPSGQGVTIYREENPAAFSKVAAEVEVGAFYWTVLAPDIVNLGREEQGSVSV